jgi:hypothetical protein
MIDLNDSMNEAQQKRNLTLSWVGPSSCKDESFIISNGNIIGCQVKHNSDLDDGVLYGGILQCSTE